MLKTLLGFFGIKEEATEINLELPEHVTTKERNRHCFLESETTRERISLKAFPVKSSCSLSVNYQKNRRFHSGDLAGHMFQLPPLRYPERKFQVLYREIPTPLFLVTEEILRDYLTMVLWETCLSSSIQKRLVDYISKLEAIRTRSYRRGFAIEVDIKVEADYLVDIGCGCKGGEACPWRVASDGLVAARVAGIDCPICLTGLSGEVCRMELRCTHVFHKRCVMKWLKKNSSCPICRAEAIGEIASIY
ncbi:unnamed protein product [Thlaspi arvense]|uniref:RING-type domain-containing protein n=1 Tax=Thlaspi arvense TaxID=13288 RepID=A0AAU9SSE5_THLAR|nr:unnamed protein product [Thlaspi arvense]